jgi:Spy/CpxP family protein refolding chaperone
MIEDLMRNKPRRLLLAGAVGLIVVLTVFPSHAGGKNRGEHAGDPQARVERQMEHLTDELSLTEDQAQQVEPILLDVAEQMVELREGRDPGDGDRSAVRDEMRKIHRAAGKELSEILDEDQMTRYRELMEQHRRQTRDHSGHGGRQKPDPV